MTSFAQDAKKRYILEVQALDMGTSTLSPWVFFILGKKMKYESYVAHNKSYELDLIH